MKQISLFAALISMFTMPALAAQSVSIDGLVEVIVYLVIVGLIFWVVWWFVGYVGVPEPFNKVIRVVMGLFALLIVISLLLSMLGHPIVNFR